MVLLFDQIYERMLLDAICERLKLALCTEGTVLVREGDPVNEMLSIIRGYLDWYIANGGRTGFFNSCRITPGGFCGEELLTWTPVQFESDSLIVSSLLNLTHKSYRRSVILIYEALKFSTSCLLLLLLPLPLPSVSNYEQIDGNYQSSPAASLCGRA
ncbi:protein CNGC15c-like [Tripterygium wilfordii]|uniref:protein CNGC15c-like n=1 Tax=Tripterygium wilfordii TaxID=458696 RepID=UPI0018F7E533|nr:protein CNGC15c-like [Tripterygium wilfordii]